MSTLDAAAASDDARHRALYDAQAPQTAEFWRRFGRHRPDVGGRKILDIGCGRGALCRELANQGADVIGIDLDKSRIAWAERNTPSVRFLAAPLSEIDEGPFDLIVCKDTMEHVVDVPGLLREVRPRLSPGGQFWVGFAPLYYSPFGDHRRLQLRVPWAHAFLPRHLIFRLASRQLGTSLTSLRDVELNGLTPEDFRAACLSAGLHFESIVYNPGDKRLLGPMRVLRHMPGLERYMTTGIYAVLTPS